MNILAKQSGIILIKTTSTFKQKRDSQMFDTIIIGGGPAGLSASVYAKRAGLNALLIDESPIHGGQMLTTYEVDNYLGLPKISGMELGKRFSEHATGTGIDKTEATVKSLSRKDGYWHAETSAGDYDTHTVILATGAVHAHLNVTGEDTLQGAGVSYCATCDGAFFKGMDVCVIGGSDVACEDAIYLARVCSHVYLIHRRDTLRAANSIVDELKKYQNVSFIWDSVVTSFNGEFELESVTLHNNKSGEDSVLNVQGAFVAVGIRPATDLVKDMVTLNQGGYVIAGEDCRTSAEGIYAAGDIRQKPMRQIITAVADGANAVCSVTEDLKA